MAPSDTAAGKAQYATDSTRRYEAVFGRDFLSTGGLSTTKPLCAAMGLEAGQRLLDVGSGLGGGAFHMVREYGMQVTCIDLEPGLVEEARRRANAYGIEGIEFIVGDVLETPEADASYDWFHSRDAFLHIEDKAQLFERAFSLLKPGGRVFVTDYGRGEGTLSEEFAEYAEATGYHLHTADAYAAFIAAAGFEDVRVDDRTADFARILREDLSRIADPATELCQADRDYLTQRWQLKQRACEAGGMRWWHIHATKPR